MTKKASAHRGSLPVGAGERESGREGEKPEPLPGGEGQVLVRALAPLEGGGLRVERGDVYAQPLAAALEMAQFGLVEFVE